MKARSYGALVAGLLVAGCAVEGDRAPGWLTGADWDIETVAAMPLQDDVYLRIIQEGYVRLARAELAEFDWTAAADFTEKAAAAANGETVMPPDVKDRSFHPDYEADLKRASRRSQAFCGAKARCCGPPSTLPKHRSTTNAGRTRPQRVR